MLEKTATFSTTQAWSTQQRLIVGLTAALLGTFMLIGVGFANSEVVHNAAHDTRHAFTFPCH
jgi:cobalt transporter subunit CbtB